MNNNIINKKKSSSALRLLPNFRYDLLEEVQGLQLRRARLVEILEIRLNILEHFARDALDAGFPETIRK